MHVYSLDLFFYHYIVVGFSTKPWFVTYYLWDDNPHRTFPKFCFDLFVFKLQTSFIFFDISNKGIIEEAKFIWWCQHIYFFDYDLFWTDKCFQRLIILYLVPIIVQITFHYLLAYTFFQERETESFCCRLYKICLNYMFGCCNFCNYC